MNKEKENKLGVIGRWSRLINGVLKM